MVIRKTVQLTCLVCGVLFHGRERTDRPTKYCSTQCRDVARRMIEPHAPAVKTCERCGETFECEYYKRNRARFCSRVCVNKMRAGETVERACEGCGTTFATPWHLRARRHCSQACANQRPRDSYAQPRYAPKACAGCGEQYSPQSGVSRYCQACVPDKNAYQRVLKYGVTYPQWIAMLDRFSGQCWVCRERPAVSLDHDHATGKPRGVTCQKCNVALHYAENLAWLEKAHDYLNGV